MVGGAELPVPGRWQIDTGHTEVAFIGRHFMLTKVRGRFTGVTGAITVAEDPGQSTAETTVNREDWGLTWNQPLDGGGLLVSRDIRIEINLEAVLQP